VHLIVTIQKTGAQRLIDLSVYTYLAFDCVGSPNFTILIFKQLPVENFSLVPSKVNICGVKIFREEDKVIK